MDPSTGKNTHKGPRGERANAVGGPERYGSAPNRHARTQGRLIRSGAVGLGQTPPWHCCPCREEHTRARLPQGPMCVLPSQLCERQQQHLQPLIHTTQTVHTALTTDDYRHLCDPGHSGWNFHINPQKRGNSISEWGNRKTGDTQNESSPTPGPHIWEEPRLPRSVWASQPHCHWSVEGTSERS